MNASHWPEGPGEVPANRNGAKAGSPPDRRPLNVPDAVRRHRWLVALVLVVTWIGTVAFWSTMEPTYEAEALLAVSPVATTDERFVGTPVIREGIAARDVETIARLARTPAVADRAAAALKSPSDPEALLDRVEIAPVGQSYLVSVRARAEEPNDAAALADAFVNATVAARTARFQERLLDIIDALEQQVRATEPSVEAAIPLRERLASLQALRRAQDPSVQVASLADPPASPSSPGLPLVLAAATLAALVLGVGGAVLLDRADRRLRETTLSPERFSLPVMGRIPFASETRASGDGSAAESYGPEAEAYRTLGRNLTLLSRNGRGVNSILFTGLGATDGITTCAMKTGQALAQAGHRVALVLLDPRRLVSEVAERLGIEGATNVGSVLSARTGLREAVSAEPASGERLRIFVAGRDDVLPDGLGAFIAPVTVRAFVSDALALGVDYVLFDAWPLGPATDALAVASALDAVVVVARMQTTDVDRLAELTEILRGHGVEPRGVVVMPPARGSAVGRRARRGRGLVHES